MRSHTTRGQFLAGVAIARQLGRPGTPVACQRWLDRARVQAHAEALLDRLDQLRGPQARVGGQPLLGERAHLVGELVAPVWLGLAGHQPVQPCSSSAAAAS